MPVRGLGTDIVCVARIAGLVERHGDRFLNRVFTAAEQTVLERIGTAASEALAARWAAKEAFVKALGPRSTNISYRDVEVVRGTSGQPMLRLHREAARALADVGAIQALVTMSHERDHATATVILV